MKKSIIKATNMHTTLIVILIIMLGLSGWGFYIAQDKLRILASDQKTNNSNPSPINSILIKKSTNITIPNSSYRALIKQDLDKYKINTGVTINNYDMSQTSTPDSLLSTNGIKSKKIKINMSSPVNYSNFIKYIKAIETNIPKINIIDLDIERSTNDKNSIIVKRLLIEVYTR